MHRAAKGSAVKPTMFVLLIIRDFSRSVRLDGLFELRIDRSNRRPVALDFLGDVREHVGVTARNVEAFQRMFQVKQQGRVVSDWLVVTIGGLGDVVGLYELSGRRRAACRDSRKRHFADSARCPIAAAGCPGRR